MLFLSKLFILTDMKLFVARHGETDGNRNALACGVFESDLTDLGREQAKTLAERLKQDQEKNQITAIYVSPLKRARDTASYIEKALNLTARIDNRLKEINFGTFEGQYWKTDEFIRIYKNPFVKFPQGESLCEVAHRAYSIIEELKQTGKSNENILFVCHGVLTAMLCTYFKSFSMEELFKLEITNCQLLEFDL